MTIRVNPDHLSEDESDYLYYLKHKNDPTYTFDDLLTKLGYEMVPTENQKTGQPLNCAI